MDRKTYIKTLTFNNIQQLTVDKLFFHFDIQNLIKEINLFVLTVLFSFFAKCTEYGRLEYNQE